MDTEQDLKNTFGYNVRILRRNRGWSQQELADKAGVTKNTISDIETCQKFARANTLVQLAKVFETAVYELLKPDDVLPDNLTDAIARYSGEVREAVDKIQSSYIENIKR